MPHKALIELASARAARQHRSSAGCAQNDGSVFENHGAFRWRGHGTPRSSGRSRRPESRLRPAGDPTGFEVAAGGVRSGRKCRRHRARSQRFLRGSRVSRPHVFRNDCSHSSSARCEDAFDACGTGCHEQRTRCSRPECIPLCIGPFAVRQQALFVPKTSVVTTTERTFVIREKNGRAEWVNVQKGSDRRRLDPGHWSTATRRPNSEASHRRNPGRKRTCKRNKLIWCPEYSYLRRT